MKREVKFYSLKMKVQNNIQDILIKNPIIPVVTFNSMDEIEPTNT